MIPNKPQERICIVENLGIATRGPEGRSLVENVSFEIRRGDYFALVGESGSGKSITCHAMMRLLPFVPDMSGRVIIDGSDVWSLDDGHLRQFRRRSVGMIFQDPLAALNPVRTIGSQMVETLKLHFPLARRDELHERSIKALEGVQIPKAESRLKVYPHQLSGGLNQRVMIAFALLGNPALLIADEPTTALDMSVQADILDLIDELRRNNNLSVLMVTHDLGIVSDRATRIAVMQAGKLIESGPAAELVHAPKAAYSRELFAASTVTVADRPKAGPRLGAECLSFRDVSKVFGADRKQAGITAAEAVSFSVKRGEIVALVGESGSGKTTAAKMTMGIIKPDSGSIEIYRSGKDGASMGAAQMVFQHPKDSLDPLMKVGDQLHEVLKVHGWSDARERSTHIANLIEEVGLQPGVLERRPTFLSGGEAQRVVIARALLLGPELLIADEPLSAVDVRIQKQIIACFKRLRDRLGIAILLITHDLRIVFEIADHVVVMRDGKVVEDVPVANFADGKRDPYTQKLINAIPGRSLVGVKPQGRSPLAEIA